MTGQLGSRGRTVLAVLLGLLVAGTACSPEAAVSAPSNSGFEVGGGSAQASAWTDYSLADAEGAAFTELGGHTGRYRLTHWSDRPYQVETYQYLTGLGMGRFMLSVWVRSGGGRHSAYIAMRNCGAAEVRTSLPTTTDWRRVSVTGDVKAGKCTLSLVSDAAAGAWANFDDVQFERVGGSEALAGARRLGQLGAPGFLVTGSILLLALAWAVIWRRRTLRPVRDLADSLQRGEERQRRIVADVAHELRTPLSTVRSHLEALIDGVLPADQEVFRSLHDEAMLQQRIVDDLQDVTLAENGKLTYHPAGLDVTAVLSSCAAAAAVEADSAGIQLAVHEAAPVHVYADPDRLRQVIGNLLSNAMRHTAAGGRISLRTAMVGASVGDSGNASFGEPGGASGIGSGIGSGGGEPGQLAVIEVADTGCGIAPDHLPHVFDRFWRADRGRGYAAGGSGLGLAIARQIVDDHGGTISVRSELGTGTTFTIRLPAVEDLPGGRHRAAPGPVKPPAR